MNPVGFKGNCCVLVLWNTLFMSTGALSITGEVCTILTFSWARSDEGGKDAWTGHLPRGPILSLGSTAYGVEDWLQAAFPALGGGQSVSLFAFLSKFEDVYTSNNNMSMFSFLLKCKSILSTHIQQNLYYLDPCLDSPRKKHGLTMFSWWLSIK